MIKFGIIAWMCGVSMIEGVHSTIHAIASNKSVQNTYLWQRVSILPYKPSHPSIHPSTQTFLEPKPFSGRDQFMIYYNFGYLPFWIGWPIKTLNQNFFRSISKKNYQNFFVIENKLLLSYRRVKSMHYPESPKVTVMPVIKQQAQNRNFSHFDFMKHSWVQSTENEGFGL